MKKICNSCEWFVEETNTIGDYRHEEAVKNQKGFCLLKDLYTMVEPSDCACEDYKSDKKRARDNEIRDAI